MLDKILFKILGIKLLTSQTGEDLIIESIITNKRDGFYIDVGANHPIKFSNTHLFYKKGWRGINIEPNPARMYLFNIFRRKDTNLNIGVGTNKSEIEFYSFKESTLSTFDKKSADDYRAMGHKLKNTFKIPVLPLNEILEKHAPNKEIDILSIDTEGYDMAVLESNDWNKFRPRFVILETLEYKRDGDGKKTNDLFDPYLEKIGYKKVADTYINSIYEKVY